MKTVKRSCTELPANHDAKLIERERRVFRAEQVPDELLAAIEATEPPPESETSERNLADKRR